MCPRCQDRRVQRWGRFGDRRRYRCLGCGRTFSDLTGTPLAHLKRLDRWPAFCDAVRAAWTVRRTATELGVHVTTSFRWRHRLLDAVRASDVTCLEGVVAVAETWFPHSEKGRRGLDRPTRPRSDLFSWSWPRVWVLLARDGAARPWAGVVGDRRPCVSALTVVLEPRLGPGRGVTLRDGAGPLGAVASFARQRGSAYRRLEGRALVDHPAVVYGSWLRRWLGLFRGVATKYLPNYLTWHRVLAVADHVTGHQRGPNPVASVQFVAGASP